MAIRYQITREAIKDIFDYIDAHNEVGVTPEELFDAGLFARKGDAGSWLSRWKGKGFLTAERIRNTDVYLRKDVKSGKRYHTVTDGSKYDWVWAFNHGFRLKKEHLMQRDVENPREYDKTIRHRR